LKRKPSKSKTKEGNKPKNPQKLNDMISYLLTVSSIFKNIYYLFGLLKN